MKGEPCWVFGWALRVQSSPWGQEGTGLAVRRVHDMVSPSSGFQGPAVSLHYCCLVRYIPGRGSHPAVLEGSRPHPPAAVTAVSLGFPRGVELRGTAVLADGGGGLLPPHAVTGLVQQPLPPLCWSSEVGMAEPSLTFPAEHESPRSLTP